MKKSKWWQSASWVAIVLVLVAASVIGVRKYVLMARVQTRTPLVSHAANSKKDGMAAELFRALGVQVDTETEIDPGGPTDIKRVKELIGRGVNLNATTRSGYTPLMVCAMADNYPALLLFEQHHANLSALGPSGESALSLAIESDYIRIVRSLLDVGANVNSQDSGGLTPLIRAVMREDPATIHLLIDRHAKFELRDNSGYTALAWTRRRSPKSTKFEQILIRAGAR